ALAARGVGFVDAPLARTPKEAEEGRLNILLGGTDEAVERARSILEACAENLFRIGPVGSAHKLKLINNFLSIGCSVVIAEAVVAARQAGVDTNTLFYVSS